MRGVKTQAMLPGMTPMSARPAKGKDQAEKPDEWPPISEMLQSLVVFESATQKSAPVTVMGIASGCVDLTLQQRALLNEADVLCAGHALLAAIAPEAENTLQLVCPLDPVLARIEQLHAAGKRVLVAADGDPLFFGIGASLVRRLGADVVRILPAVSCLQLACARLGLPSHNVVCLSLHGRDDMAPLNAATGADAPLFVLTDGHTRPDALARHLLDRGVDWFFAHIFENLNTPDETATHVSLDKAAGMHFGPACTLVLTPVGKARRPCLGLNAQDLAAESSLVTKAPVRAAALALLRIEPAHAVWDLGSGSGAMALEAAALAHQGRVTAVEKKPERAVCIEENRRRFGAATVDVHLGEAPQCLAALPDPQRVFIGGGLSGEQGRDILHHASLRLPPGGRIAVNCALLNTLHLCRDFFDSLGWPVVIVSIQAAEARPLGSDVHLAALNPVFVLAAQKPA
ncbi:precorrin-6y C5,15-methyltransferase (decarboxylating) subunit CbiE [Candidatus Desulfovibrio trichonymphae]|uniref:Precorrin-6Y C5,15-methyltransferase n=1 Tax=Candidatus Desulfovibrio trichonymphae TaxID=1725232 RepID=A0A1J1DYX0_9BACT|nr:precorrin-6y C5,15-methyltransferase (decarboxylating) subunit CbiE [Candidatus Desulfovibrio trichonymphae]BAV92326.1 precorrin-6Y C5,15-methyltransferase [Candidatus Desulfovibrio trichonymphae]GHU97943.1 precorrin-6Y C5,15-methyltransferase (decarboxylating) [Deltaproteobacteria bacterium]